MKIKSTLNIAQWWNIVEIHNRERNSKMVWFSSREKVHGMLVNDEIRLKLVIVREILIWSPFHEERNHIARWSMMKYCRNSSSSEGYQNDLILMKRKSTSNIGRWWNIMEIHPAESNSKAIVFWPKGEERVTLLNDEILLKFIIFRQILKWSYCDEQKQYIGCWSMMKYCGDSSSWEKF